MLNFEKQIKESNAETIAREQAHAEQVAAENGTTYSDNTSHTDLRDSTNAVDPKTGKIGEEHAPTDRTVENGGETPAPETPTPTNTPTEPEQDTLVLASVKENQGKKTNFADPDLEKGLWDTLDKKMQEALKGSSPEELGQNMAFAFLTFWCELVANYADHIRRERKRLDKEYKEKTAEWDKNIGVTSAHKTLAIWATIADHPAMKEFANKPISNETVRAAYNLYRTDMATQKTALRIISAMSGRELTKKEANTYFENAFKTKFGNATLSNIKGMALNNDKLMEGIQLAGVQKAILSTHQQVQGHQESVAQNQTDRSNLNAAQNQTQQAPDYTRTNTSGRSI